MEAARLDHVRSFYSLLHDLEERVGGRRRLSSCTGRIAWPTRGVYFFFEEGEDRTDSGPGPRVVRVGTHALTSGSSTTLWKRLSQHRGSSRSGGGNHRGSIFRLIVGEALAARGGVELPRSWARGSSADPAARDSELGHEKRVSSCIGRMHVLWVPITDPPGSESLRGTVERNAIALLSNYRRQPIDPPSEEWLGRSSARQRVRESGLWNQNHVEEAYDPSFLHTLEALISAVLT